MKLSFLSKVAWLIEARQGGVNRVAINIKACGVNAYQEIADVRGNKRVSSHSTQWLDEGDFRILKDTMISVLKTKKFDAWLNALKDTVGKVRIAARIQRLELGNPGDVAPVGEGISEMRIHAGPGYRVYFKQAGKTIPAAVWRRQKQSGTRY